MSEHARVRNENLIDRVKQRYLCTERRCVQSYDLLHKASELLTDAKTTVAASRQKLQISRTALEDSQQCYAASFIWNAIWGRETPQADKSLALTTNISADAYHAASRWFHYYSSSIPALPPREEFKELSLAVADAEVPGYASTAFQKVFVRAFHQWCMKLYEKTTGTSFVL